MMDLLPASWFVPEMHDVVIDFLFNLPIDAVDKKKAWLYWCRIAGVEVTGNDIARVTGQPPGTL